MNGYELVTRCWTNTMQSDQVLDMEEASDYQASKDNVRTKNSPSMRKSSLKTRKCAKRAKRYRSGRTYQRGSLSNRTLEEHALRRREGCALSISSESNSSNTEPQTYSIRTVPAWQNVSSVWPQTHLENAIDSLVRQTPSYLASFQEMVLAREMPDFVQLPHNIVDALILSASLHGNVKLLAHLLRCGANPNTRDEEKRSALHYAATSLASTAVECVSELLESGATVDLWDKNRIATPLICAASVGNLGILEALLNAGAEIDAGLNNTVNSSTFTALTWAIRARNQACASMLLQAGAQVNTPQAYSEAPIHVAATQGDAKCLRILLENKADVRVLLGQSRMSALHLAAEEGNSECISLLLDAKADCNMPNARGQTPLHLAILSHSIEAVTVLLEAGANPNALDEDMKSPLHSAVMKSSRSSDMVRLLLSYGASIDARDSFGYTPLHLAAIHENSKVGEILVLSGADWSARNKGGVNALSLLLRRTPEVLKAIPRRFDSALVIADHDALDPDCELHLDFKKLIPNHAGGIGETGLLMALVLSGQRQILEHAIVQAFLQVKWTKIRFLFIASLLFHGTFVFLLTIHIISRFIIQGRDCVTRETEENDSEITFKKRESADECLFIEWPFWLVVSIQYANIVLITVSGMKEFFQLLQKPGDYVRNIENCIHLGLILGVVAINLPPQWNFYDWQQHIAAIIIVIAWMELMMHVGRFPGFGIYVQMFATVATNIAKFLAAYVSLIIGFSLGFAVLYPDTESLARLPYSLVTTIVMMTGELDYNDRFNEPNGSKYPITSHALFLVFLLFVVIVLMNLLVGLAVSDIQGLQKSARLDRLVRQVHLVARMESILISPCLKPRTCWLVRKINATQSALQHKILVVPSPFKRIYSVRPNDPRDDRFPIDIKESLMKILMTDYSSSSHNRSRYVEQDLRVFGSELLDEKFRELIDLLGNAIDEIRVSKENFEQHLRKVKEPDQIELI